jgi:PAS domain S-box-containing protein
MLSLSADLRYRMALDAIPFQLYVINRSFEITFLNQTIRRFLRELGYGDDFVGRRITEAFPFTDGYLEEEAKRVFDSGAPLRSDHVLSVGGRTIHAEMHRFPLLDERGKVAEAVSVIHDVTDERLLRMDLQHSRALFETMVENANSIILRMDLDGRITYFNTFAEKFFGYARSEVMQRTVTETIVPHRDSFGLDLTTLIDDIIRDPERYASNENENVKKDGTRVWISWSNKPIFDDTGRVIELLCVGNDITELKRTQRELEAYRSSLEELVRRRTRALEESQHRYRFLFEESPAGSIVIAPDGTILDVNASFLSILGYDKCETIGRPAADFIVPERRDHIGEMLRRRFSGEILPDEDVPVIAKNGSNHTLVFARGQALMRDNNRITGLLLCGNDITERRKAEEAARQQREELIRTDKLASLGILVSGVAHEINNPNNYILLNAGNLREIWKDMCKTVDKIAPGEPSLSIAGLPYSEVRTEGENLIVSVAEGAQRIRSIVQNLKDFARQAPPDMNREIDLNRVVEAAITIMANLLKKSTNRFVDKRANLLPAVRGDFQKIEQVVINLLTNACQALTGRDQAVEVTTRCNEGDSSVTLTIRDEGCGIKPEIIKNIFDPFFTTKRDAGGTGLGLAISYGIVKDHHGSLTVESGEGTGTVFTMTLPLEI